MYFFDRWTSFFPIFDQNVSYKMNFKKHKIIWRETIHFLLTSCFCYLHIKQFVFTGYNFILVFTPYSWEQGHFLIKTGFCFKQVLLYLHPACNQQMKWKTDICNKLIKMCLVTKNCKFQFWWDSNILLCSLLVWCVMTDKQGRVHINSETSWVGTMLSMLTDMLSKVHYT
jgi:hypothetical protein